MLYITTKYSLEEKRYIKQIVTEDGTVFMSDTAYEKQNMAAAARWFKGGKALIGGLGLGIIVKMIEPRAELVDVVENDSNVINVISPTIESQKITVILDDLVKFVDKSSYEHWYDYIFLDIWPDLDYLRLPAIYKLEEKCHRLLVENGRIISWGKWFMQQRYKEELHRFVSDLKQYNMKIFPASKYQEISAQHPYFGEFCKCLVDNPGIWKDTKKINKIINRSLNSFISGQEYLGINEITHGVPVYK